jgi:hypothetical protein
MRHMLVTSLVELTTATSVEKYEQAQCGISVQALKKRFTVLIDWLDGFEGDKKHLAMLSLGGCLISLRPS